MLMFGRIPPDVPSVTVPLTAYVTAVAGLVIVTWSLPETFWYVAVMSASPAAAPLTLPVLPTTATSVFEDTQAAWLVTFCVVPFESVAVAVNWAVEPTSGAEPATDTADTVGDAGVGVVGVGEAGVAVPLLLHA
jgi:hypothetical protein